ncbi:MAG: ribonuclease HII [Acidobacteriota bacterium]|nr:ribonuclease HII [Acidobacteriota bacterium]
MPRSSSTASTRKPGNGAKQRLLRTLVCTDAQEQALRAQGYCCIAGVDEVGRGALFGPVVAAAVVLPQQPDGLHGLRDSKQLTQRERERLDAAIRSVARGVSVVEVDAATIDDINIYQATRQAMTQAVLALETPPDHLLIDAMRLDLPCPQTSLIHGDALSLSIAAASVVAKVYRDRLMEQLDRLHPGYGLAAHKGYGTARHLQALRALGPLPLHRHSFAPVRLAAAAPATGNGIPA